MSKGYRPIIVAVAGVASNIGKTTLVCELLRGLPQWEAIKVTKGHYRSCGKDDTCCVSDLLQAEPVIHSGRTPETDQPGKDTGYFWAAGASNVHWVIATGEQVEEGLKRALSRVHAPGVVVEGTSFLKTTPADYAIMVVNPIVEKIKGSARRALSQAQAYYVNESGANDQSREEWLAEWLKRNQFDRALPVFWSSDISRILESIGLIRAGTHGR